MSWRDFLDEDDVHGVTIFEVVAKPPGTNVYAPLTPPVTFEAGYRWADSTEKYTMGKTDTLKVARVYADPPLVVTEKQGLRSPLTGTVNGQVLNVVSAVEERGAAIVLVIAERTA